MNTKYYIIILLLVLINPVCTSAQGGDTYITNLETQSSGMLINDIVYAENKLFVYSYKGVLIYSATTNTLLAEIDFGGSNSEYGQYMFPFELIDETPSYSHLALDDGHYLYVVTPSLNLIRINTLTNQKDNTFSITSPTGTILSGGQIIKYDISHDRLYWSYKIKDQIETYFAVYQIDEFNNVSQMDQFSGNDAINRIFDIAFNETNDAFYLSRSNGYEVWEIVNNNFVLKNTIGLGNIERNGNLVYVRNNSFHKVFCMPFSYSVSVPAPSNVFVIDGNNYNNTSYFNIAYNKVRTAAFDLNKNNLLLGYQNDEANSLTYDIDVYNFNTDVATPVQQITTTTPLVKDNSPLNLTKRGNDFILSKNDEIFVLEADEVNTTYTSSLITEAKSNFFYKSVTTSNNKNYLIKTASSGLELINTDNTLGNSIFTGSMIYKSSFSDFSQKAYFYSNQHFENSRITIVNTKTNTVENTLELEKPIGDVVYNPYNNEFIVIENKNGATAFNTYDAVSNTSKQSYPANMSHCQKMFITPNNRLFITGNMVPNNGDVKIRVFDATTYQFIKQLEFEVPVLGTTSDGYLKAAFAFNYYNKRVYAVFRRDKNNIAPYNPTDAEGAFVEISEDLVISNYFTDNMYNPEQIICDNNSRIIVGDFSQRAFSYYGSCLIRMRGAGTDRTIIYDCYYSTFNDLTPPSLPNSITYNPRTDLFYGLSNGSENGKVFSIDKSGTTAVIHSSYDISASRNIQFNPYNGRLYMYALRNYDHSNNNVYLYSLNPENTSAGLTQTYLHNKSLKLTPEHDIIFKNELVFDPYSNRVYVPNGTHGNISVAGFDAYEILQLKGAQSKYHNWLSFPRTIKSGGNPSVIQVLDNYGNGQANIDPDNYLNPSQLENVPLDVPDENTPLTNTYSNQTGWDDDGYLTSFNNTFGYRLYLRYEPYPLDDPYLKMYGTVPEPSTSLTLLPNGKENWVGYWLYYTQDVFEALGSTVNYINLIKLQDRFCVKTDAIDGMGDPEPSPSYWRCSEKETFVKYGDMLVLKGNGSNLNFQWKLQGNIVPTANNNHPEYYTYEVLSDYKPIVLELESGDHPLEVGSFVDNTCVGASVVAPDDSTVLIRAYVANNNDTITFQKYYGTKSGQKHIVDDYYVYNPQLKTWKKGYAINRADKDRFFVSFKKKEVLQQEGVNDNQFTFKLYPNPANRFINVEYILDKPVELSLSVYNIQGQKVYGTTINGSGAGKFITRLKLENAHGNSLKRGIYLLKLSTPTQIAVERLVIE